MPNQWRGTFRLCVGCGDISNLGIDIHTGMFRIFRHYIPTALLCLFLLEALALVLSVKAGVVAREFWGNSGPDVRDDAVWGRALVFASVFLVCLGMFGLYRRSMRGGKNEMLLRLVLGMLAGLSVMSMLFYIFPDLFLRRGAFAFAFGFSLVALVLIRVAFFRLVGGEFFNRRVLVLGANEGGRQFKQFRRRSDRLGFVVVAFVQLPGESVSEIGDKVVSLDVSLLEYVEQEGVQEIVVACGGREPPGLLDDLLDCKMSGVDVIDIVTFVERHMGKIRVDMLTPTWLIYSDGFRRGMLQGATKRCFDIGVSGLMLVLFLPVMLLISIAIKMEDGVRAPVFFRQVRVGKNWGLFRIIKFRSMAVNSVGEVRWTDEEDERVTRVGRFIRRARLDELPQVINVLKGDMSFVGPRPEQPGFVEILVDSVPYYAERHRVKPGITGWAQIHYPYGASERDALEKLQYDLYYLKNRSLFLDVLVLVQTAETVLSGDGAR